MQCAVGCEKNKANVKGRRKEGKTRAEMSLLESKSGKHFAVRGSVFH